MALNKSFSFCDRCKEKAKKSSRRQLLAELCDNCRKLQKEGSIHCLEATILVNGNTIEKCEIVSSSNNACSVSIDRLLDVEQDGDSSPSSNCSCQACVERKYLSREQLRDVQDLQKCWVQLRHTIRQMYRDRLLPGCITGKGKKIDKNKIKELVDKLCVSDAHQLFQRLECQAKEYVMDLKVQLLQILVSPQELGFANGVSKAHDDSNRVRTLTSEITADIAEHFLKSLLGLTRDFFGTLDNMLPLLEKLENHLSKFEITWLTVNYSLFDSVIFQDPLVRVTLPAVYRAVGFHTVFPIIYSLEEADFSLVQALSEAASTACPEKRQLICSLWEFDSSVFLHRKQMNEARQRMDDFLAKQMKIYQGKLRAKQKMLKQDLEFFKQKRRLLEEYVSKKKESKKIPSANDEDLATFAEALRGMLCSRRRGRRADGSSAPPPTLDDSTTAKCPRCHEIHCPCDQCTVAHLITCGLVESRGGQFDDASSAEDEHENHSFKILSDCTNACSDSSSSSIDSSDSDGSDGDSGDCNNHPDIEIETSKGSFSNLDVVCRKHSSIIRSNGQKITKFEATILPTSYYRTKSSDSADSLNRQIYQAYGDWEVSTDPTSVLLNLPLDGNGGYPSSPTSASNVAATQRREGHRSCKTRGGGVPSKKCIAVKATTTAKVGRRRRRSSASAAVGGSMAASAAAPDLIRDILAHGVKKNVADGRPVPTSGVTGAKNSTSTICEDDLVDSRVPPEFFEMMKDEKLAKALAAAVVKRNGLSVKGCSLKAEAPRWRDLNFDDEAVRKMIDSNVSVKTAKDTSQTDPRNQPNEKELSDQKSQNDVDTSSERSSSTPPSITSKDGKHCDCCHCEMFGQNNNRFGRDDFPQIRERLRLKLKNKFMDTLPTECQNNKNANDASKTAVFPPSNQNCILKHENLHIDGSGLATNGGNPAGELYRSDEIQGYRGFESIDKLMEYIEGNNSANNSKNIKQQSIKKQPKKQTKKKCINKSAKVAGQLASNAKEEKIFAKLNSADEQWSIDEVFKPKDIDLETCDLDEAEKEVEIFKRFVFDCRPAEKREKINLDLSHLSIHHSTRDQPNVQNSSAKLAVCQS